MERLAVSAPLLLLGDRGMLGRAFRELLTAKHRPFTGFDLPELDIAEPSQIGPIFERPWSAVINCAAYTNVDGAEADEPVALRANGIAPGVVAAACARARIPLVHFSTDYVFAGNASAPYAVAAPLQPLGAYGRTKAAGESAIRHSGADFLILRTSWLYAPWANNFVRTMARLTRDKPELKVVDDQRGRPTSAQHLAAATLALLDRGTRGTLHVTDGGECTWYEFTVEIARLLGRNAIIRPCTTAEFPRPAPRPVYSVLDLAPTEAILGPMPDWRLNLASVVAQLEPL
ncbi:MAG TPA: dTDP-4-dehydrorhamnose reductase [Polyangia bacterium]|nr:dTDP-4-dehydrorhamnose reductase [Polyangia bacterium]